MRKFIEKKKGHDDDNMFDFTKSKKGLGELYEEDFKKKLTSNDPNAYLTSDLTGTDSGIKVEIDSLMKNLFYQLDQLSNFNFTPKPPGKEAAITTQNVPAIMLEDAIPINVSKGQTKSAREVFAIADK